MAKRMTMGAVTQQQCDQERCSGPLWERHASSSEGAVNLELWPGNLLIITQSVDDARMQALRPILLAPAKTMRASAGQPELGQPELAPRLLAIPQIEALSEKAGIEFGLEIRQQFAH